MLPLEVAPNVHQLVIRGGNVYVVAEESLTLIDTGFPGSAPAIVDFIRRRLGRSPQEIDRVFITHNHVDHMGSVPELRRLAHFRLAAHRAGLAAPDDEPSYPGRVIRLLRAPLFSEVRRRVVLVPDDVDLPLEGGEVLDGLGGLEVVHTPGHTPGSISLYSPRRRLLFVGDAVQRRRRYLRLPAKRVSTDMPQAVDSVRKMAALDVAVLCFGHGRPVTRGAGEMLADLVSRCAATVGAKA